MPILDFVYFNAGGGHRAAALALQAVIEQQHRPWTVRLIDLARVLDPHSSFRRLLGFDPEDVYNKRLQRGWTLGLSQELRLLQGAIRFGHASMLRVLQRHWAKTEPDLVISLVPNFNRVLCESVASALPGVPFVTLMTDMATPRAISQARAEGYNDAQLELTSGMVIKPTFYDLPPINRATRRIALGLDPMRPTGVVMFGGQGSQQMLRIARELDGTQLLLMCGRNRALADACRRLRRSAKQAVVGFTEEVADVMRLADFFIGKPGPGGLSEAVQLGLPVITIKNAWTMPQERYNAQWVHEQGVGIVVPSVARLPAAADQLLQRLSEFRAATSRIDNRAVFEVPELLAGLLTASQTTPAWQLSRRAARASC